MLEKPGARGGGKRAILLWRKTTDSGYKGRESYFTVVSLKMMWTNRIGLTDTKENNKCIASFHGRWGNRIKIFKGREQLHHIVSPKMLWMKRTGSRCKEKEAKYSVLYFMEDDVNEQSKIKIHILYIKLKKEKTEHCFFSWKIGTASRYKGRKQCMALFHGRWCKRTEQDQDT